MSRAKRAHIGHYYASPGRAVSASIVLRRCMRDDIYIYINYTHCARRLSGAKIAADCVHGELFVVGVVGVLILLI